MFIYFLPILLLFLLSKYKISSGKQWLIAICLMLFLCFGYMTGSDWRIYEVDYTEGFKYRLVEPGYMLLSNMSSSIGINFWSFHILLKCVSFLCIISLIYKLHDKKNPNFAIAIWYASYGLYLFINCPFRNLIACGIGALSVISLLENKKSLFYILCVLAISFHVSSVVLFILPLCKFERLSSKFLVTLYLGLMVVLILGGTKFLVNILYSVLPSFLTSRLDFYSDSTGSVLSVGLIPRLICLYLLMKYRSNIIIRNKYGSVVFSFAYASLLLSLIYYVFPMLFRTALFLSPFYVVAISFGLQESAPKYRQLFRIAVSCIFIAIVFTTVRSVYYVPYTNIITHAIKDELYDFDYRDNYNFLMSPFGGGRED